jgi:hypothetical protein
MGKHANTKIGFTPDKYIIIVMELTTKDAPWESMSGSCSKFTDDFMQERRQGTQEREDPFK